MTRHVDYLGGVAIDRVVSLFKTGRVGDGVIFYLDTQYTATVVDNVTVGCYGVIEHEGFCGVGGDEVAEAG